MQARCPSILARTKSNVGEVKYAMLSGYRHWLEYDPVALAVLLIGVAFVAVLVLSI
jgi:hypothetical protein